ncbi:hypothetical protein BH20ACI2_BH20ACI2_24840 [soil metagenome]
MAKKVKKNRALELSTTGTAVLVILLAVMRLSELIPVSRSSGGSSQNWRLDIYVSVLLVICSVWIYKNRAEAAAKLASMDKLVRVTLYCLAGFTIWGAFSALWAFSWASVLLHTLTWILFLAVLVYSLILFRTKNGLTAVVTACMIAASVTAILCLIDFYQVTEPSRDTGLIRIKYARLAECFLTVSPLLCVWALYVRGRLAIVAVVTGWLLSWLVVMLSTSKGAFLAGIIGHLVLFFGCILLTKYPIRRKMASLACIWLAFTLITQIAHAALSPLPTTTEFMSGEADPTRETSLMRIFTWQVSWQMAVDNPLIGVGANNFGINFNPTRREFNKTHTNIAEEIVEHYFPERAHNEFLQIVAELGVVGAMLFASVFAVFMIFLFRNFRSNRYTLSPLLWASLAGMAAFFGSSFVSSFSFRIAQNGVFFFIIFALALSEVDKMQKHKETIAEKWPRPLLICTIAGAVISMILLGARGYADIQVREADKASRLSRAMPYYSSAAFFDPDNFYAHHRMGVRYANEGQHAAAAAAIRKMIDLGGGTTLNYSVMAEYLINAGQYKAANDAFEEAVAIYPNSVFLRVRYAVYLEERGQRAEADANLEHARLVNAKQANGWYLLIIREAGKGGGAAEDDVELTDNLLPKDARTYYQSRPGKIGTAPFQRFSY